MLLFTENTAMLLYKTFQASTSTVHALIKKVNVLRAYYTYGYGHTFWGGGGGGTVCGWSWDPLDSNVVCQQLGYKEVKRTYSRTSQHNFGEGTGQSWLSYLRCTGSEANLLQCPHYGVGIECDHSGDVGVACTNEDLPGEGEWMWANRRKNQFKVNHIQ